MNRLRRYLNMIIILCCRGGYARGKLLKRKNILKLKGQIAFFNRGILDLNPN